MNELREIPAGWMILIIAALLLQGTWLFRNARKRGKRAWFWGLWGVTTVPTPTVVYLLVVIFPEVRKQRKNGRES